VKDTIEKANEIYNKGEYLEAQKIYASLIKKSKGKDTKIIVPYFKTFLASGKYSEGLKEAEKLLKEHPGISALFNARGKFLKITGRYKEAESTFKQARSIDKNFVENNIDLADVYRLKGKKQQAKALYTEVFNKYTMGVYSSAQHICLAGIAASNLEEFHAANQAFRSSYQRDQENIENLARWANLFNEKYNKADAQRTYEEAIELNPHNADIFAGYARSLESFSAMEEMAKKALEKNQNHVEALNILAELHILDSRYDEAESIVKQALNVNPSSVISLANLASIYHLKELTNEFKEIERKALEINPLCGNFYIKLSSNCGLRFRYKDAVEFSQKAVETQPDNWNAHSTLGIDLLRIGNVNDATRYLNTAFENDPFNLFAKNSLDLIDEYNDYNVLESEHFSLKIHRSESITLGNTILELAEESFDSLIVYYPYIPSGKILIEAYNDHSDFAVRISGLPNLDLLGVCFGDIVAFDTPGAQTENEYNWARTLWHELAHVMSIGLSDHRVPRWLTEGLSVYEEKRARPEWTRKMDLELYLALKQDKLLSLDKINTGFTRPDFPGRIFLTYYQSMKIVEFLINRYGFRTIPELLTGFKNRKSTEENFLSIFNKKPDEITREFFEFLKKDMDKLKEIAAGFEGMFNEKKRKSLITDKTLQKSGNPYFKACEDARKHLDQKNYADAEKMFLKAIEIYPYPIGNENPHLKLAAIYRILDDNDKLENILKQYLTITEYGAPEARELADLYSKKQAFERAEYYLRRSLYTEPYEIKTHFQLAEIYKKQSLYNKEVEERRILLALDPVDKAEAFYSLALSLYNENKIEDAKKEVLKSLEIAPGYKDAQKLLLRCIRN